MQTFETLAGLRNALAVFRDHHQSIVLVPTMGNLHEGHLSLMQIARQRADRVVASIFVNPMQFDNPADFAAYGRTIEEDRRKLSASQVDVLFYPEVGEIYPHGTKRCTRVEVPGLSDILCGKFRPGHFVGVTTLVNKLFNIVQPEVAVFGEKDYQQLLLIRRMAADLCLPVEVVGAPTVREIHGLAMSSRNNYLNPRERLQAGALYRALCLARDGIMAVEGGAPGDYSAIEQVATDALVAEGLRPDYFSIRRAVDLEAPGADDRRLVILVAAWLGSARLIDNLQITLK